MRVCGGGGARLGNACDLVAEDVEVVVSGTASVTVTVSVCVGGGCMPPLTRRGWHLDALQVRVLAQKNDKKACRGGSNELRAWASTEGVWKQVWAGCGRDGDVGSAAWSSRAIVPLVAEESLAPTAADSCAAAVPMTCL
eukprot:364230-Chlamydomonas_euryale.AAC.4